MKRRSDRSDRTQKRKISLLKPSSSEVERANKNTKKLKFSMVNLARKVSANNHLTNFQAKKQQIMDYLKNVPSLDGLHSVNNGILNVNESIKLQSFFLDQTCNSSLAYRSNVPTVLIPSS